MISFPLGLWDVSLLLAVTAIVLLITSEMLSPYYGRINIQISKTRLRNTALATSILFLATVTLRIISLITNP